MSLEAWSVLARVVSDRPVLAQTGHSSGSLGLRRSNRDVVVSECSGRLDDKFG